MVNKTELSMKQAAAIKAMRTYFGKKTVVSRTDLVEYAKSIGQIYAPGFIVKNEAFKARDKKGEEIRGMYNLLACKSLTKKSESTEKPVSTSKKSSKKVTEPVETVETVAATDRMLLLEGEPEVAFQVGN